MATQKGRNWSSGDIVTAANLSSIERGVSAVAEEYTPTTWANGNTVTAAALNNIEQGIVNAGGGSSDFSTAQVTVRGNSEQYFQMFGVVADISQKLELEEPHLAIDTIDSSVTGDTYTVVLYQGTTYGLAGASSEAIAVSGNVSLLAAEHGTIFVITGDCTITISDSSGGLL